MRTKVELLKLILTYIEEKGIKDELPPFHEPTSWGGIDTCIGLCPLLSTIRIYKEITEEEYLELTALFKKHRPKKGLNGQCWWEARKSAPRITFLKRLIAFYEKETQKIKK